MDKFFRNQKTELTGYVFIYEHESVVDNHCKKGRVGDNHIWERHVDFKMYVY